ncbi:MAG: hypothetical protein WKF30_17375, partial [Pyrinomonadaceae bacterium]
KDEGGRMKDEIKDGRTFINFFYPELSSFRLPPSSLFLGVCRGSALVLADVLGEHLLCLFGAAGVFLFCFAEELNQLLIALLFGVCQIERHGLGSLQQMIGGAD